MTDKYDLSGIDTLPAATAQPSRAQSKYDLSAIDQVPASTGFDKTAALFTAAFGNPSEEAEKRRLSADIERITGTYAPVVDIADATRRRQQLQADHATRASPRTSEFLSVQENAAVAIQDAKTMAQIEAIIGGDPLRSAEIAAKRMLMSTGSLGAQVGFDAPAVLTDIVGESLRAVGVPNDYNVLREMSTAARRQATATRAAIDYFTPEARNIVERAAVSAGTSAGMSLQLAPLAMGTPQGAGMAAAFGLGTLAESYTRARDAGKGVLDSLKYAIPQGAYEALFEMAPAKFLADALKTAPGIKQFAVGLAAREVPTELATTLSQNFNDWVTFNPEKPLSEFLAEQPEALAETAIATIMGAGIQAGVIHTAQRATGQFQIMQEERRVKAHTEQLTALMQAAKDLKSDPVTVQSFMSGLTDGAKVFVDTAELENVLAQNGIEMSALPTAADLLSQGPSITGDVEIPIGELVTAFAGTPGAEQIVQHARRQQSDLSAADYAKMGDVGAFLKSSSAEVMAKQQENEQFQSELDEIEASFTGQLPNVPNIDKTGYTTRDQRLVGSMVRQFYAVAADFTKMSPKQVAEIWSVKFPGAEQTTSQEQNLSQGFDHGNAMLNVGLDVGATDRAQKIDADFVKAEIEKMGVQVLSSEQVQGEYEYEGQMVQELTYVPHLSRPLTEAEVNQLAIATGQEAIGQYDNGTGNLWGPNAANWGAFNPEFFKDQTGVSLAAAQKPKYKAVDVNSPEFKAWFGESKVVDENGKPLRVYHGTASDVGAFDPAKAGSNYPSTGGQRGFYFTDKPGTAAVYAEQAALDGGENTMPVYLSLQNPVERKTSGSPDKYFDYNRDKILAAAEKAGADGVIVRGGARTLYIAFKPEHIKSAISNTGAFQGPDLLNQSQSARRPTTKRAPEDHLGEAPLSVDYTKIEPNKTEQNMKLVSQYPGIRFKARKAEGRAEEFIQHVTNNLLWLHDQIPAEIRQRSKLWYDGARAITDRWAAKYDKTDAQIAAILAVYSPQKDWFMNVSLAERTLDIVANQQDTAWSPEMTEVADKILADEKFAMLRGAIEGKKLSDLKDRLEQAAWLRTFDEAHNNRGHRLVTPEGGFIEFAVSTKGAEKKTGWPGFGTIIKALYVIDDGSPKVIDNALGGEHKVRSFYNNIFHPTSDVGFVTIDTHAVAAGLLRPLSGNSVEVTHNFGGAGTAASAATGMSGTYAYYQEAYRRAAEARGLLPREMQSITWEAVRELYTMGFKHDTAKMAVVDKLWSEYEKGKRDLDSVRAGILNLAGGVEQPSWVGRDSGISPEGWASTYTGELLGDQLPGRAAGTVDAGPGERAAAGNAGADLAQAVRSSGAVAGPVVGIHYSKAPRTALASSMSGQGMKGAEAERIAASKDPRIKQRVNFYVNTGNGITPESDVGSNPHVATLRNLYDADADALKIWRTSKGDMNVAESAVLDAGFDGYLTRNFGKQGAVVMLGQRSVEVASVKPADVSTVAEQPPSPEIPKMKQAAIAIMQNRALVTGRQSVESWKRDLERVDPDTAALIDWASIKPGDYYKDEIAGALWQDAPALFAEAAGPRRGSFNPLSYELRLTPDANRTTVIHELSHFFMAAYIEMAQQPNAPAELTEFVENLLGYLFKNVTGEVGATGTAIERWNAMTLDQQRPYWEAFAEGFEQYALTGKAPTKALQTAFSAFAKWMTSVYKTVKNFLTQTGGKPLDAELTQYFDRMLATEAELEAAREERGYKALFKTLADSGMSPAQFADYMAQDELQKTEGNELLLSRSLRDMKWLSGAKSRAIKELQAEVAELRALVQAGVEEELADTPLRKAERWLRNGEMVQDGEQIKAAAGHRFDMAIIKAMFPEGAIAGQIDFAKLGRGKTALAASTGTQHPDEVAQIFGFRSGEQLVRELVEMPSFKDEVAYLTDLRMLEEHGDLATPEAIDKAADAAIHNAAHLKMVATEVWALNNKIGSVASLVKAAKAFAENLVDNTVVKKLRPVQYANAATKAGKMAVRALAKKDTDTAAREKRTEMINAAAAKAAYAAEAEVRAIMTRLRKIANYSDKHSSVTSREFGVVQAVRAILADFEIGSKGEKAQTYVKVVAEYDPQLGALLQATIDEVADVAKPWQDLKVADLRELRAAIDGLWRAAQEIRNVELAGEKMTLDEARAELIEKIKENRKAGRKPGSDYAVTDAEIRGQEFMSAVAIGIRPETWIAMQDGLDDYGPWRRLIWNAIERAQVAYQDDQAAKLKELKALLEPIMADMRDVQIDAPELGYTFGKGSAPGYAELLHAIIHTGNASNKERLLLIPRTDTVAPWGSVKQDGTLDTAKWDAFMARMFAEGKITRAHMDFVQGVWDWLESTKEGAQRAHRATTGRYFPEIPATELVTPFGTYRGGYAPAIADRRLSPTAEAQQAIDAMQQDVMHTFEKPLAGFTKERSANAVKGRPLELNIASLGRHIDTVLLFSHMSVPVRNVQRVLRGDGVLSALTEKDRDAMLKVIMPWLNSAVTQKAVELGKHSVQNWRVWSTARSRGGMATMVANVSNSIQQLTGFFPALTLVSKKELLFAASKEFYRPRELAASVSAMSPYMRQRLDNEVRALADEVDQIMINPTKFEKAQDWASRHAYFMQTAVDVAMSPIIWQARFNEVMAEGEGKQLDADGVAALRQKAIDLADTAVKMTQGSNRAIDVAAIEKGSPFYRMFMQFAGWFNSQANLLGMKLARERLLPDGMAKNGRIAMHLALIWWAPAIASMIIAVAMRGGPDDKDGDGLWDDWLADLLLAPVKFALAAVPVAGAAIATLINSFNDKPYDDRMPVAPVISLVEAGAKGAAGAVAAFEDPTKAGRAIRDLGMFFSLFGVPVTPATKAVGYATDVATGKVDPTGPVDYGRGIITGTASPESKR